VGAQLSELANDRGRLGYPAVSNTLEDIMRIKSDLVGYRLEVLGSALAEQTYIMKTSIWKVWADSSWVEAHIY
jgi:hypothetical protein